MPQEDGQVRTVDAHTVEITQPTGTEHADERQHVDYADDLEDRRHDKAHRASPVLHQIWIPREILWKKSFEKKKPDEHETTVQAP